MLFCIRQLNMSESNSPNKQNVKKNRYFCSPKKLSKNHKKKVS